MYGRASAHTARSTFYTELIDTPVVKDTITNTNNTIFIMGDFNYQYKDCRWDGALTSAPVEWTDLFDDYFIDVLGDEKHTTWHSGLNAGILDYVFCSSNAHHLVTNSSQQYLSPELTDHELLGFSFQFLDANGRGPGSWKANPFLAGSKDFRKALAEFLNGSEERLSAINSSLVCCSSSGPTQHIG